MTNQREALLQSIATTIADYRQGEIRTINPSHVNRWVTQFDKFGCGDNAQIVILEQMDRILKTYYISHEKAEAFIHRALISEKLLGSDPAKTLPNITFLQIQTKGSSQKDLVSICDSLLQRLYGIEVKDCGRNPIAYIYFDDCLYSGNRVRRDIISWLPTAIHGTTLHIIFFGHHTEGFEYSKRKIEEQARLKNISVHFWKWYEFHNSRRNPSRFDCFWSHEISGDQLVDQYIHAVNNQRLQKFNQSFPPLFRPNDMPTQDSIFSSPDARKVIEYAFLKAGAYIVSLPRSPNSSMRPLGYDYLESLGFGAILITYRNIANNCPLALWWGDPNKAYPLNAWYPLFPRTVNTTPIAELEEF